MNEKIKKLILITLCTTMLLSIVTVAATAENVNKFTDVLENEWYFEYVNFVSKKGIMNGKGGEFRPLDITTRAEYVFALYNAAGAPWVTGERFFSDVPEDSEYADAITWAKVYNITSGTGEGIFEPNASLTREMAMTFLYRALTTLDIKAETPTTSAITRFSDNTLVSDWAQTAMNTLVNMKIINGTDEGKLNPQGELVNCEVATMLYKILNIENQNNEVDEEQRELLDDFQSDKEAQDQYNEEMNEEYFEEEYFDEYEY